MAMSLTTLVLVRRPVRVGHNNGFLVSEVDRVVVGTTAVRERRARRPGGSGGVITSSHGENYPPLLSDIRSSPYVLSPWQASRYNAKEVKAETPTASPKDETRIRLAARLQVGSANLNSET